MRAILATLLLSAICFHAPTQAQEITLESAPPVIVKSVPESGASDIDPATTEIRVTFSKTMQDGSWSWAAASKATFPETTGNAKYAEDARTCILPVKLQPGKTYAIWINSQTLHNFKDDAGNPAVPYLLIFKTRDR